MNDHLTKPIDPAHLIATLVEWIPVPTDRPAQSHGTARSGRAQIPPDLLALTTIEPLEGVRRIGGSADSYIRQLKRFRKHYGNAIEELQRTIADQGLRRAEEICHALKGVVGNLAADRLFDAVSSIDAHLRAGLAPPSPMLGRAAAELDSLVAEIDGLQSRESSKPSGLSEPRVAEIKSLVDRLKVVLRYDFGKAAPLIKELGDATAGTRLEDQFNEFNDLVDIFEIDAAMEPLNKMTLPIEANRDE